MPSYKTTTVIASIFLMLLSLTMINSYMYLIFYNCKYMIQLDFFEMNSMFMSISFIMDWTTTLFSALVCFISSCVTMFSFSYMSKDIFIKRFTWIIMLFVLSMNFLIFIPNMVSLLLGWDGLGLVSFCLVIYYQNSKSLGAGLITAFMNRIGDVGIMMSIGWTSTQAHWESMFMENYIFFTMTAMMILIAGMTKSAQIPFSSWLPAAMAAPTPVSALVHSSTLVTAGVFILIRFFTLLDTFYIFKYMLLITAISTMLMAGVAANYETDLKKIIALSTLSQLGMMMSSIGSGMPLLALTHLFTHALFKALLFLCAGSIIHYHMNNQDTRKMSQLWNRLPISSTCFNIANLALCGFPFFAGFYSKDFIIEMMLMNQMNMITMTLVSLSTFFTVMYSMRLSMTIFWNEIKQTPMLSYSDENFSLCSPIIILTLGSIFSGPMFSWMFLSPMVFPFLSNTNKLSTTLILMLSAYLNITMTKEMTKTNNFSNYLFSSMWFMTFISNNLISKPYMTNSFTTLKIMDMGWLEYLGSEKIFNLLIFCSKVNQNYQSNYMNFFLFMMSTSLLLMPLFIFML
uniref:NADH-ubiquinone oxidoreductase chain 5 n=1 Tax=Tonicina zschaui TaxID=2719129 RepID=A0A6H1PG07_9MOLL|nr:NADH dehydrogenase subunit 5 [Tonicina zschaui]